MTDIEWFQDAATRFIELLQQHSWNESVRILKAEKASQHHVGLERLHNVTIGKSHNETFEKLDTVPQLKAEKDVKYCSLSEVEGKSA